MDFPQVEQAFIVGRQHPGHFILKQQPLKQRLFSLKISVPDNIRKNKNKPFSSRADAF